MCLFKEIHPVIILHSNRVLEGFILFYRHNSNFCMMTQDLWEKKVKHIGTVGKKRSISKDMECMDTEYKPQNIQRAHKMIVIQRDIGLLSYWNVIIKYFHKYIFYTC